MGRIRYALIKEQEEDENTRKLEDKQKNLDKDTHKNRRGKTRVFPPSATENVGIISSLNEEYNNQIPG